MSRSGGTEPRWRGDGKEIFYIGPKSMLTRSPSIRATHFRRETHVAVPHSDPSSGVFHDQSSYDVTKDGQRFLVTSTLSPRRSLRCTSSSMPPQA